MNAEDQKKLDELAGLAFTSSRHIDSLKRVIDAYALGRRAGMTEAAGICVALREEWLLGKVKSEISDFRTCAAAIEKARDK